MKIGYCFTGSFCTFKRSLEAMRRLSEMGHEIVPIMSENAYATDTRFQRAADFSAEVELICRREIIHTGNTLAKVSAGITDTAATMAIKAHLRTDRPTLIALASNDAMSRNLKNVGDMLGRKSVYFVPMLQDDPVGKPHSLVAELEMIPMAVEAAMRGEQLRPIFLTLPTV